MRSLWEAGVVVEGARAGADRYALACADWGRSRLGSFDRADRLVELVTAVVDGAELAGLSLFAGWQSQTRVNDPLGRCYQLLNVLANFAAVCTLPLSLLMASRLFKRCSPTRKITGLRRPSVSVGLLHLKMLTTCATIS